MNKYNPEIHKRHSIRLKNFDYSREGLYFITICCKNREHLFGEIVDGKMILNDIGEIANNEWMKTTAVRGNVVLHHFVVMPNHFHAIVKITHRDNDDNISNIRRGVLHTPFDNDDDNGVCNTPLSSEGVCNTPLRSPSQTLGAIIRGYKSAVSKMAGFSVWHRNYHEHIIRNENAYYRISEYIKNNPQKWNEDCFYS